MIEKYGQAFKELREDKNISTRKLEQLSIKADPTRRISASNISKFEREETNIGFPKITALLNIMNVPISEYVMHVEELQDSVLDDFKGIKEAYADEDIERLEYLRKIYKENKESLSRYEHLSILCEALIKTIKNEEVNKESVEIIQHYLLNIDNWHYYEVTLFANMVFIFDSDVVQLLVRKSVKILEEYKSMSNYSHETALLLSNVVIVFIESDQLEYAKTYIDLIYKYLKGTRHIYEKLKCDFLLGCYYYLSDEKEKGLRQAQEAISLMKKLELNKEAENHHLYFIDLIEENI